MAGRKVAVIQPTGWCYLVTMDEFEFVHRRQSDEFPPRINELNELIHRVAGLWKPDVIEFRGF